MDLIILKYGKPTAKLIESVFKDVEIPEQEFIALKTLVNDYIDLKNKASSSLLRSGYVSTDIVTDLKTKTLQICKIKTQYGLKGTFFKIIEDK